MSHSIGTPNVTPNVSRKGIINLLGHFALRHASFNAYLKLDGEDAPFVGVIPDLEVKVSGNWIDDVLGTADYLNMQQVPLYSKKSLYEANDQMALAGTYNRFSAITNDVSRGNIQ